jgi:threonine aldolase
MRQVGILAAAGRYALDHQLTRLAQDHAHARSIAEAVAEVLPSAVDPADVETNIVVLDLTACGRPAADVAAAAREHGVLVSALGPRMVRAVTHLDLDDEAAAGAAGVLAKVLSV